MSVPIKGMGRLVKTGTQYTKENISMSFGIMKKSKSLDQILGAFITVRDELGQAMKELQAQKNDKEQQVVVLKSQMEELDTQSIRAARAYQKAQELLGE